MALEDGIIIFEGPVVKPLNYFEQITKIPNRADRLDLPLRLANYGVKPTARVFNTTRKTVRRWLGRYRQERLAGLNELPRIPLTCPHKTPSVVARKIVNLRRQLPFKRAKRLKSELHLPCSHEAIRRTLQECGLIKKRPAPSQSGQRALLGP